MIELALRNPEKAGGCMACTEHRTSVWVITVKKRSASDQGWQTRFCVQCLQELMWRTGLAKKPGHIEET